MSWVRRARRWWLGRRPIPAVWARIVAEEVPFAAGLDPRRRERLLALTHVFALEKRFVGAAGMEIDDRVRVVISATAARLVLHLHLGYYDRVHEIARMLGGDPESAASREHARELLASGSAPRSGERA